MKQLVLALLVAFFWQDVFAVNTFDEAILRDRLACAAGIQPNIISMKEDRRFSLLYLQTIKENQYSETKQSFGVTYSAVFGANYDEMQKNIRQYFQQQMLSIEDNRRVAIYVSSVSDKARSDYFNCVVRVSEGRIGVSSYFVNQSRTAATLHVLYKDSPNVSQTTLHFRPIGSKNRTIAPITLRPGGSTDIDLERATEGGELRVTIQAGNLSDSVVSVVPLPPPICTTKTIPHSEELTLTTAGNYVAAMPAGNPVNCPNCLTLYRATLTPSHPVEAFDSVALVRSSPAHWYRCGAGAEPAFCDTSEFTPTPTRVVGATCVGSPSCIIWRASKNAGTDVVNVIYHSTETTCVQAKTETTQKRKKLVRTN